MAEERTRRIKCLTLNRICIDISVDDLSGVNAKRIEANEIVMLSAMQYEHYARNKCVTKDLPLDEV